MLLRCVLRVPPRDRGVVALLAGPRGSGKTLAAEILATHLRLGLYQIDLAAVVSKYIDETEKNLAQVFQDAERSGTILFFDEGDALFGQRSEVKDGDNRYANIDVDCLLKRMEDCEGVDILTTNCRWSYDWVAP
jgi:SpoVK/Ycf46/Vps4 family AAA+-type ATPase